MMFVIVITEIQLFTVLEFAQAFVHRRFLCKHSSCSQYNAAFNYVKSIVGR